jgi:hypothetical protein
MAWKFFGFSASNREPLIAKDAEFTQSEQRKLAVGIVDSAGSVALSKTEMSLLGSISFRVEEGDRKHLK